MYKINIGDAGDNRAKILIVDDDPRLLKAYHLKMSREGLNAHTLNDSVRAIEEARNSQPDVIVLDVLMPIKSGWDILRELKSDSILKHIPVLLVSNIGSVEKEVEAIEAGASAYVVKSDTPLSDLIVLIRKFGPDDSTE
jgi:DNA-binding response OmpR family regulator